MTVVPSDYIDIDSELDTIYKGDIKALQRIKKVIGLQKRHVAPKHITASDLGEYAATLLLKGMNIDAKSIDALIMVTQTPDYFLHNFYGFLWISKTNPMNEFLFC